MVLSTTGCGLIKRNWHIAPPPRKIPQPPPPFFFCLWKSVVIETQKLLFLLKAQSHIFLRKMKKTKKSLRNNGVHPGRHCGTHITVWEYRISFLPFMWFCRQCCRMEHSSLNKSRETFLLAAVSTQNWGQGRNAYKPDTNLRPVTIQVNIFTGSTALEKALTPAFPPQIVLQRMLVVVQWPFLPFFHGKPSFVQGHDSPAKNYTSQLCVATQWGCSPWKLSSFHPSNSVVRMVELNGEDCEEGLAPGHETSRWLCKNGGWLRKWLC